MYNKKVAEIEKAYEQVHRREEKAHQKETQEWGKLLNKRDAKGFQKATQGAFAAKLQAAVKGNKHG